MSETRVAYLLHVTRAASPIERSISIRRSSEISLKVRVNLESVVERAIMRKFDYKLPDAVWLQAHG